MIETATYEEVKSFLNNLEDQHSNKNSKVKITIDQRFCPVCKEISIVGKVYEKDAYEWEEIDDLNFLYNINAEQN